MLQKTDSMRRMSFPERIKSIVLKVALLSIVTGLGCPDAARMLDAGADAGFDAGTGIVEIDVESYSIEIAIDPLQVSFEAQTTLALEVLSAGLELALDLDEDVSVDDVTGVGANFVHEDDTLIITPDTELAPGFLELTIAYHGSLNELARFTPSSCPVAFGGLMLTENSHGATIINSYNWPYYARRWIPAHDHPSDGAALELSVTIDSAYTVVANGTLDDTELLGDGRTTWQWSEEREMPTYDIHIAAFPFEEHDLGLGGGTIPVTAFLYPEDDDQALPLYDALSAMEFLGENIERDYPWEKYALVAAPICGGAMEEATAVTMDEFTLADPDSSSETVVHELVHHWFGNSVRIASWNDFWISEGFAMNLTGLYILDQYGADAFADYMSVSWELAHYGESPGADHPLRPEDPEVDVYDIFDTISYDKANWILHSLRKHIGDDAFWASVSVFYQLHEFASATTSELKEAFESTTGVDLDWFWDAFVYSEYHPVLSGSLDYSSGMATVTVTQLQDRGLDVYEIPIDVEIYDHEGNSLKTTIDLATNPHSEEIEVGFTPTRLVLDPDEKLYADIRCASSDDCPDGRECNGSCAR